MILLGNILATIFVLSLLTLIKNLLKIVTLLDIFYAPLWQYIMFIYFPVVVILTAIWR